MDCRGAAGSSAGSRAEPSVNDRLIDLMRAGDLAAVDLMAREHGERLAAVARRCCRRPDDVADAVQQGLLEAVRSLDSWEGRGSPLAWLGSLVAHSCYRMNRGRKNDPALHQDDDGVPCGRCDPEQAAARRQEVERVAAAIDGLPRPDRLALLLALEGWTGPSQRGANRLGGSADCAARCRRWTSVTCLDTLPSARLGLPPRSLTDLGRKFTSSC